MQYHEIGKTGMKVSSLSFGASSLGGVFHDIKEKEAIEAVFTAIETGMNFIDVSPYYGHYKAETVLGKALQADFRAVIHYMQSGNCPVEQFVSAVVVPEEARQAMERWAARPGKVFRILVKL